jgi:hypothetical protein
MKHFALRLALPFFPLLVLSCATTKPLAQSHAQTGKLFNTIASLDSAVFDAYNRCDLETFGRYFSGDVEFYHDQGGVMTGREKLMESVKNNICGRVRRKLVPGTLEVYPIHGYGAVEIGVHRFYELNGNHPDRPSGEAKFTHVWQQKDGVWVITRVISYAHEEVR